MDNTEYSDGIILADVEPLWLRAIEREFTKNSFLWQKKDIISVDSGDQAYNLLVTEKRLPRYLVLGGYMPPGPTGQSILKEAYQSGRASEIERIAFLVASLRPGLENEINQHNLKYGNVKLFTKPLRDVKDITNYLRSKELVSI